MSKSCFEDNNIQALSARAAKVVPTEVDGTLPKGANSWKALLRPKMASGAPVEVLLAAMSLGFAECRLST
jgi:hypothetical protein